MCSECGADRTDTWADGEDRRICGRCAIKQRDEARAQVRQLLDEYQCQGSELAEAQAEVQRLKEENERLKFDYADVCKRIEYWVQRVNEAERLREGK